MQNIIVSMSMLHHY